MSTSKCADCGRIRWLVKSLCVDCTGDRKLYGDEVIDAPEQARRSCLYCNRLHYSIDALARHEAECRNGETLGLPISAGWAAVDAEDAPLTDCIICGAPAGESRFCFGAPGSTMNTSDVPHTYR